MIREALYQARAEFAREAAERGLVIFRSWVPINTGELQAQITAFVEDDKAIIEVRAASIHDGKSAKRIAIALNIGLSEAGRLLKRSRSNQATGAQSGSLTKDWITNAIRETKEVLTPIGRGLLKEAAAKAVKGMISG